MKMLHSSQDITLVNYLGGLLESAGIECEVRNQVLGMAAGGVPPTECWVELWVVDDGRFEEARQLLDRAAPAGTSAAAWTCARCGESVEGQFSDCWNCGAGRPDAPLAT